MTFSRRADRLGDINELVKLDARHATFPPKTKNNVASSIAHKADAEEDRQRPRTREL
jgi:hypothetical protein